MGLPEIGCSSVGGGKYSVGCVISYPAIPITQQYVVVA